MSLFDQAISYLDQLAEMEVDEAYERLPKWAGDVRSSPDAREVLRRLCRCKARVLTLLDVVARFHTPGRSLFEEAIVGQVTEFGCHIDLDQPRDLNAILLGEEARRPSDLPLDVAQMVRLILKDRALSNREPSTVSGLATDGSEVEVETIPGTAGVLFGRLRGPREVEPGRPSPAGSGRRAETAPAVMAVLVAAHIRKLDPDAVASLVPAFLVHVVRHREDYTSVNPVKAERQRLRRHEKVAWVRRRVARIARMLDLAVALD